MCLEPLFMMCRPPKTKPDDLVEYHFESQFLETHVRLVESALEIMFPGSKCSAQVSHRVFECEECRMSVLANICYPRIVEQADNCCPCSTRFNGCMNLNDFQHCGSVTILITRQL
jgi:hypothetical protein